MKKIAGRTSKIISILLFVLIMAAHLSAQNKGEVIAIKNVNLIPMTSEKVIPSQVVLVNGGKISEIGSVHEVKIPLNAVVIDGTGKYLMPGLADMHLHPGEFNEPVHPIDLLLANGVTTIRGCQTENGGIYLLRWKDEINKGTRIGPKIYTSGLTFYNNYNSTINSYQVSEQMKLGFDFIKLYSGLSKDNFNNLMAIAKEKKLYTIGHIPFSVGLDGVITAGMDEIAHIEEIIFNETFPIDRNAGYKDLFQWYLNWGKEVLDIYKPGGRKELLAKTDSALNSIVERLKEKNIPVHTTLFLDEVIIKKLLYAEDFKAAIEWKYLTDNFRNNFLNGREKHQRQFKGFEELSVAKYILDSALCAKLAKAGVPLVLGTDATIGMGLVAGMSVPCELEALAKCGMSPYQALLTATVNASKAIEAMTGTNEFGTIEKGKRADMILLDKNPLENISNIRQLIGTMVGGNWIPQEILKQRIEIVENHTPKSGRNILAKIIAEKGINSAIDTYWESKNAVSKEKRLNVGYGEINNLGYDLLKKGMTIEAVEFFKLNAIEYPMNSNVYDSLAEGYLSAGNKILAVENYKKALLWNPDSENAKKALKDLGQ